MAKIVSLEDLFIHELKDLYSAESQLTKALPKMAKAALHPELKAAFQAHLEETKGQLERLVEISGLVGKKLTGHTCAAMKGLIEEASDMVDEDATPEVKDAGLIAQGQRVEHYEISGYGSAKALAKQLGHKDVMALLDQSLAEEKSADSKLNKLALTKVNPAAFAAGQEEDEEGEEE